MDRYPDDGQIPPEFERHGSSGKRLDRSGCRSLKCALFRAKCRLNSARIVTEPGAPVQIRLPCGSYRKIRQLRPFPHYSPSPDYRNHGTDTRASQMIARRVRRGKCPDCNRRRLDGSPISWNAHDSSVSQLIVQPVMQVNLTYANECALLVLLRFASSSKRPLSNSPSSPPPRWCREPDHTTTPLAIRKRRTGNSTGIIGTYVQGGGGG